MALTTFHVPLRSLENDPPFWLPSQRPLQSGNNYKLQKACPCNYSNDADCNNDAEISICSPSPNRLVSVWIGLRLNMHSLTVVTHAPAQIWIILRAEWSLSWNVELRGRWSLIRTWTGSFRSCIKLQFKSPLPLELVVALYRELHGLEVVDCLE